MREILFRGKRTDNGEWVYGTPILYPDGNVVMCRAFKRNHNVSSKTVCQFIGLTDKKGRMVFEGDIIKCKVHEMNGYRVRKGVIEYHDTGFIMNLKPNSDSGYDQKNVPFEREVIGNVFDNPELLEV